MVTDNQGLEEEASGAAKVVVILMVTIIVVSSLSLFILYSTMRSRSIGIATGYLKAIEYSYQTGTLDFNKNLPEQSFETGIYRANVTSIKSRSINDAIIVKIEIRDKFFSVNHYSEELRLIPMYNTVE